MDCNRVTRLLMVAMLALLAGCGSSSSSEPSKGDFIASGDEICKRANQDFDAAVRAHQVASPADAEELTSVLLRISEGEVEQLRDLQPPSELSADFGAYLKARDKGVDLIRQANEAAREENPQGYVSAISELHQTQDERSGLAEKVGFSSCSQELVPSPGATG